MKLKSQTNQKVFGENGNTEVLGGQLDENGVIVNEENIEFNGDINFTGNVTGVGGTKLFKHLITTNEYNFVKVLVISSNENAYSSVSSLANDIMNGKVTFALLNDATGGDFEFKSSNTLVGVGLSGMSVIFNSNKTLTPSIEFTDDTITSL